MEQYVPVMAQKGYEAHPPPFGLHFPLRGGQGIFPGYNGLGEFRVVTTSNGKRSYKESYENMFIFKDSYKIFSPFPNDFQDFRRDEKNLLFFCPAEIVSFSLRGFRKIFPHKLCPKELVTRT